MHSNLPFLFQNLPPPPFPPPRSFHCFVKFLPRTYTTTSFPLVCSSRFVRVLFFQFVLLFPMPSQCYFGHFPSLGIIFYFIDFNLFFFLSPYVSGGECSEPPSCYSCPLKKVERLSQQKPEIFFFCSFCLTLVMNNYCDASSQATARGAGSFSTSERRPLFLRGFKAGSPANTFNRAD